MRTKSISIKSQCNSRTLFVCHKKLQILVHARSFLGSKVQKSKVNTRDDNIISLYILYSLPPHETLKSLKLARVR